VRGWLQQAQQTRGEQSLLSSGFPLRTSRTRRRPFHQRLASTSLLAWPVSPHVYRGFAAVPRRWQWRGVAAENLTERKCCKNIPRYFYFFFLRESVARALTFWRVHGSLYLKLCEMSCSEQLSPIAAAAAFAGVLLGPCSSLGLCCSSRERWTCCRLG